MKALSERKRVVLYHVMHNNVVRVRWEYRILEKVNGRIQLGDCVTATIYALEDQELIRLFMNGTIESTPLARVAMRERETEEVREDDLIDADYS